MFYTTNSKTGLLSSEESRHCTKVLRKNVGDSIELFDGMGTSYIAILTKVGKECTYQIEKTERHKSPYKPVHIAIAPPKKAARMDFMIEKLVELGIQKLTFLSTQHSERSRLNPERIKKQVISACKQSKQYYLPEIDYNTSLKQIIESYTNLYTCHCNPNITKTSIQEIKTPALNAIWLIGPEGDFSIQELEMLKESKATFIDLGEQRLRTETAAIYVMSALKYLTD